MKARSYLRNIKSKYKHGNDWFQVKPGTAAIAVAETTPTEVMQYAGRSTTCLSWTLRTFWRCLRTTRTQSVRSMSGGFCNAGS